MKKYLLMVAAFLQMQPMAYAATYSGPVEDMKRAYDKANDPISLKDFPTADELRTGLKQPIYSLGYLGLLRTATTTDVINAEITALIRIEFSIPGIPPKGPLVPGTPDRKTVLLSSCIPPYEGQKGSLSCDNVDRAFKTNSVAYEVLYKMENEYLVLKPTEIQRIDKLKGWRQIVRKSGKLFFIRNYNAKSDDRNGDKYSYGWVN